eukprot:c21848_g1_i4 orf=211-1455(-)
MAPKKNPKKASPAQKEAADSKKKKNDVAGVGEGDKSDQVSPAEMRKQLDVLQMEKSKEGQERNYAQLERDKIASFLEIKKKEVEQAKAELRLKDRYFEEMEERHQDEIKVYNQKMKHVLYEQQNKIATVKIENELSLKLQREQAAKIEMELRNDQRALKERIKELELGYEDAIKQVKLDHAKEQTKKKQEFDVTAKELQLRMEKKEDMNDMKKKEAVNEKIMYEIAQENKKLTEPLTKALKEVENLRKWLANYEKDKVSLQQSITAHGEVIKKLTNLEFEHGLLLHQFDEVKSERDGLYKKFENGIFEMQQKSDLKNNLLQRKVQVLSENLEKKNAQLVDFQSATNKDPNVVQQAKDNIDKVLDLKNTEIKQLHYELGKLTKAYKDAIEAFEMKLGEYGIPLEEMGLLHCMPCF